MSIAGLTKQQRKSQIFLKAFMEINGLAVEPGTFYNEIKPFIGNASYIYEQGHRENRECLNKDFKRTLTTYYNGLQARRSELEKLKEETAQFLAKNKKSFFFKKKQTSYSTDQNSAEYLTKLTKEKKKVLNELNFNPVISEDNDKNLKQVKILMDAIQKKSKKFFSLMDNLIKLNNQRATQRSNFINEKNMKKKKAFLAKYFKIQNELNLAILKINENDDFGRRIDKTPLLGDSSRSYFITYPSKANFKSTFDTTEAEMKKGTLTFKDCKKQFQNYFNELTQSLIVPPTPIASGTEDSRSSMSSASCPPNTVSPLKTSNTNEIKKTLDTINSQIKIEGR